MSAAERAIRDALPALEAIADRMNATRAEVERASGMYLGHLRDLTAEVALLRAALQGALGDDSVAPGPTTAQEGSEGLSGQMSGVSGETVELRPGEWTPVTTTVPIHQPCDRFQDDGRTRRCANCGWRITAHPEETKP